MPARAYDPLDPATLRDPFSVYRRLREEAPVFWHDELYSWVLTRHEDCRFVLRNPQLFTQDRRKLGRPVQEAGMTIQSLDPPDPLPLRQAIIASLKAVDMDAVCETARAELELRVRSWASGQTVEFMQEVAEPIAGRFACSLLGVEPFPAETYRPIFLALTRAMDAALEPNRHLEGLDGNARLFELLRPQLGRCVRGGMLGHLAGEIGVEGLSSPYVLNTVAATFNAAFSTAYSATGSLLALLVERPSLVDEMVGRDCIKLGVNELLRYLSPAQATSRYACEDTEIGGVAIARNDPIVTVLAAANRDPACFTRPDEILVDRSPNPHLSFGHGPHFCVGAAAAVRYLSTFIRFLADTGRQLTIVGPATYLDTATLRCFDRLEVVCDG
jgi:cytochrome P450